MRLAPTESQTMIAESARRLFAGFALAERRKQWHGAYLSEPYARLAEAGMLELALPRDGDDESFADLAAFAVELGRSAIAVPLTQSAIAAAYLLQATGQTGQAASLSGGTTIAATAFAEDGGTLAGMLRPRTRLAGGRLTGVKNVVSFAGEAGLLLTTATHEDGALSLIYMNAGHPGLSMSRLNTVAGEPLYEVTFDCAVDDGAILATGEHCRQLLRDVLERVFLVQSAILTGGAERALEIVTEHVIQRYQFGQPLGAFQAVQHHIANSRMRMDAARLMVNELAWRLATHQAQGLAWAAETKIWVAAASAEILRRAHELQGGISVVDEHETMLLLRRNLAETISWGATQELLPLCYPLQMTPPTVQPLFETLA